MSISIDRMCIAVIDEATKLRHICVYLAGDVDSKKELLAIYIHFIY
ncbi:MULTISPECIES: hypothetical protein [Candidatus Nitrosocaldus]|jgi:hypothetical protein|uniref:Uncharacterized protein n=1 Tax=Candidatus Nitrosocaldus cavascurensis TaxID=2058097 RepID=A0A2K5AR43_9ARCH|nr:MULTISPECIES: hypothetical protein [Candidatus Nitrosocaldus]SPC34120.1 protein of unknown function [Candidatus Nitrosocaldus cavascurensis]